MKFYTDGSRIGLHEDRTIIGWAAVCDLGVICSDAKVGGSNVNAEMFVILRDYV
ncbi:MULTISPECIES: hypothetical protein [Clostridium]|uniref:hypothetical protein n=1 Tax=Clostridium TaxID=1485 RepID=UPI0034A391DC